MIFINPPSSPFEPPSLLYHFVSSPLTFVVQYLYRSLLVLRRPPFPHPDPSSSVRLVCISDTHTKKATIPPGDVLIHAGDLANQGSAGEIQDQIDWIASLPHKYKIVVAGNHDSYFDPRSRHPSDLEKKIHFADVHYLQHSSITLMFQHAGHRRLSFYGAPHIPVCGGDEFAFQYPLRQDAWSGTIPRSTDVLITHTPPRHHLDLPHGMGCEFLLKDVWNVRPKVHVFGHVHAGYGQEKVFWDETQKAYERVCARNQAGFFMDSLDLFAWLDCIRMIWYGVTGIIWDWVWRGNAAGTVNINASLTLGSTGKLGNAPQVVDV
ncbi:MAG: hypothetical protein Q9222_000236 [Ikaeria aurantiellina]